eukprot:jgi/Ulvmu1/4874/UM020_0160.1
MASSTDSRSIRSQRLRPSFVEAFEANGIHRLYEWQANAVQAAGHAGKNFVYSAPTSGGKSLVADILMLNALQRSGTNWQKPRMKALVLVPYLSIAAERCAYLARLCHRSNLCVKGYASSDSGCPFGSPRENIAVCSYEKGNSAINRLVASSKIADLCCVVIDEFHMLVEPGRGAALEVLISKLRYFAATTAQLICISATMRGLDSVIDWLDAELFKTDFRPVQLQEHVVLGQAVFEVKGVPLSQGRVETNRTCSQPTHNPCVSHVPAFPGEMAPAIGAAGLQLARVLPKLDERIITKGPRTFQIGDHVMLQLAVECMQGSKGGCLVFCNSRKACESSAIAMCKQVPQGAISDDDRQARLSVALDLLATQSGQLHQPLQELMLTAAGVAYHHAELSYSERRAVEQAFRAGLFHTLFCTSTLAAGINLPASACIIKCRSDPHAVRRSEYLQMIGRAGRAGLCETGSSYLVCDYAIPVRDAAAPEAVGHNKCSVRTALGVMQAQVAELKSNLMPKDWCTLSEEDQLNYGGPKLDPMKKLVLEVMVLQNLTTRDVFKLMHVTLAASEIRCAHTTGRTADDALLQPNSQQTGEDSRMHPLYQCGLAALRALNQEAFVSNFDDTAGDTCNKADLKFPTTALGRAVFESGLPLSHAKSLHAKLQETCILGLCVDVHPLHLLWLLLQAADAPYQIADWSAYIKLVQMDEFFPDSIRTFADRVSLIPQKGPHRDKLLQPGKLPSKDVKVKHGTLLIAICLSQVLSEDKDPHEVAARWACVRRTHNPLTLPPVNGRSLQNLLRNDIAQQAAMAGLLCESAGWPLLATLLSDLSTDAAAGGRPELRELLKVDGLDASRARALYKAGLKTPQAVLEAGSMAVKQALAKALPSSMQRRTGPGVKGGTLTAAQIGLGADIGANQLLVRSVESVETLVRKYITGLHEERELELAAAETEAADLAAVYSSWSSQQAVPSPTQLVSQGRYPGNTFDESQELLTSCSTVRGSARDFRSAPTQLCHASVQQAPVARCASQQVQATFPTWVAAHPPERSRLHMSSTATLSQQCKRSWSLVPVYQQLSALPQRGSQGAPASAVEGCVPQGCAAVSLTSSSELASSHDRTHQAPYTKALRRDIPFKNCVSHSQNVPGDFRLTGLGATLPAGAHNSVMGWLPPDHSQSARARPAPRFADSAVAATQPAFHTLASVGSGSVQANVPGATPHLLTWQTLGSKP